MSKLNVAIAELNELQSRAKERLITEQELINAVVELKQYKKNLNKIEKKYWQSITLKMAYALPMSYKWLGEGTWATITLFRNGAYKVIVGRGKCAKSRQGFTKKITVEYE